LEIKAIKLERFASRRARTATEQGKTEATAASVLPGASFQLRAGEIFGLAGLIGAGRTDLVRAIFGLEPLADGEVCVVGAPQNAATPRARWTQGVGFVSEN